MRKQSRVFLKQKHNLKKNKVKIKRFLLNKIINRAQCYNKRVKKRQQGLILQRQ